MQCLFGGSETDSKEHVVPAWLQRRFKLQEQTINIPNGTTLKYKLLVVPADKTENRKFGEIEDRISNGHFNLDEVYLWALKIHIGLIFRDSSLRVDIRDPKSEFILDIGSFESEIALFRILYEHWKGGGKTSPSPFGSVFILDSLLPPNEFDLFHCLVTGTVGIHIGGKFIVVFLWDQGDAMAANIEAQWTRHHLPTAASYIGHADYADHCYMAHHVWACESAYWLYRNRRRLNMLRSPEHIALVPPAFRPQAQPVVEEQYRHICRSFGLELTKFSGEVGNVYTQHSRIQA
ncbi:hypothetical protein [Variovorax sp. tm]|uniref:hypothetical protein n=1 Tax=Variovorax atrisoli TaxID=3394203 RepID=UPI003A801F1D